MKRKGKGILTTTTDQLARMTPQARGHGMPQTSDFSRVVVRPRQCSDADTMSSWHHCNSASLWPPISLCSQSIFSENKKFFPPNFYAIRIYY